LKDNHLLAKWLSEPLVLEYYEGRDNSFDLEKVNKKFYQRKNGVIGCIVEFENVEIGYIQFYGIDQFIGEIKYWNRGIGTLLVKSMVEFLIVQKHADRVVMDPQTWNERAIRCYEKSGFERVKLLPKNELHEGEYRDCWLIEYAK